MKVSIVIQARSTSKRFPGKIFAKIGGVQVLKHVLNAANDSAKYVNYQTHKHNIKVDVAIVTPTNDELIKYYGKYNIIQGDEDDVLGRYVLAQKKLDSDYIVRITADCPFVPPYMISKMINIAVRDQLDFITNADPRYRTYPDGFDVEIISKKMLGWLDKNATNEFREHVTNYLVDNFPEWASRGDIIGFCDLSGLKLSIDTKEDLESLNKMNEKISSTIDMVRRGYRL